MAHRYSGPGFWGEGLTQITSRKHPVSGTMVQVPLWNGIIRTVRDKLCEPMSWRKPDLVFVNSMSDLFHTGVGDEYREAIFGVMIACSQHSFQVLTKRDKHMRDVMTAMQAKVQESRSVEFLLGRAHRMSLGRTIPAHRERLRMMSTPLITPEGGNSPWPIPNVWLGVSVEDRERVSRVQNLRETPASIRFVSFEPLLEDLGELDLTGIDWAIIGGESGSRARSMELAWARNIVEQARAQGVPLFVKQLGRRWSDENLSKDLKGGKMRDWPNDLQIREMPERV